MKRYLVIETFKPNCLERAYERFHSKGRMLPEGLFYLDSWLEKKGRRCFQLMDARDPALFKEWVEKWDDLVDFEVIEVGEKPEKS